MSGIYDLAKGILNRRDFDRTIGLASSAAATSAPSPRAAGLGGGGNTAKVDEGYWEGKRAADQARRDAETNVSSGTFSGMMGTAAKQTNALNALGNADESNRQHNRTLAAYNDSQGRGGAPDTSGTTTIADNIKSEISPRGANGQEVATDQNGLPPPTPVGQSGGGEPSESPSYIGEDDEEDQSAGYDTDSNDSGGEPMATGGRVRAGGLYHVAEGGKDELYVQDDGDTFPLTDDMRMRPREAGVIVPNPEVAKMARAGIGNRSASPVSDKEYRRQLQEVSYRRNEIDRRAKSGELDALPSHYLTQDERSALAPIQAKREVETKKAAAQAREEIGRKNPYALAPELEKTYAAETERTRQLAEFQSDPRTRQDLLNRATIRQRGIDSAAAKAGAVDAANDPYVKIQNEQEKERQRILGEQQSKRDAATGAIAREYLTNPQAYADTHDIAQANVAAQITKQHLERQMGVAGAKGVPINVPTFKDTGEMVSGINYDARKKAETRASLEPAPRPAPQPSPGGGGQGQPAGAPAQGSNQPAASRPAPQPTALATNLSTGEVTSVSGQEYQSGMRQAQGKGFDHVSIARILNDPKVKPEYKEQLHADLTPEQRTVVRYSMESTPRYDAALKAADDARKSGPSMWDVAADNVGKTWDFFTGGKSEASAPSPDQYKPNIGERIRASLAPSVEQASASVRNSVYPSERSPEPAQDWEAMRQAVRSRLNTGAVQDPTTSGDSMPVGMTDDLENNSLAYRIGRGFRASLGR